MTINTLIVSHAINKDNLDKLYGPALRALSVPASSAPVKRIFSHGGIIMVCFFLFKAFIWIAPKVTNNEKE